MGGEGAGKAGAEFHAPWVGWLVLIVLAAVGLRGWKVFAADAVSRDGTKYCRIAQALADDPLDTMRAEAYPPGYPAAILAVHDVLRLPETPAGWAAAGIGISFVASLGVVVAVFWLGRLAYDTGAGLLAAAFAALLPALIDIGADAISDALHLMLYLWALGCLVTGVRRTMDPAPPAAGRAFVWLAGSGTLSGLAYLVRPEGGGIALGGLIVYAALAVRQRRLARHAVAGAVLLAAFLLPAGPYMVITGELIHKKPILRRLLRLFRDEPAAEQTKVPGWARGPSRARARARTDVPTVVPDRGLAGGRAGGTLRPPLPLGEGWGEGCFPPPERRPPRSRGVPARRDCQERKPLEFGSSRRNRAHEVSDSGTGPESFRSLAIPPPGLRQSKQSLLQGLAPSLFYTSRAGGPRPQAPLEARQGRYRLAQPVRAGEGRTLSLPFFLGWEPRQGRQRRCSARRLAPLTGLRTRRRDKWADGIPALTGWANLWRPCGPEDRHVDARTCVEQRGLVPLATRIGPAGAAEPADGPPTQVGAMTRTYVPDNTRWAVRGLPSPAGVAWDRMLDLVEEYFQACRYVFAVLALLVLAPGVGPMRPAARAAMTAACGVHLAAVVLLAQLYYDPAMRHLIPPATLTLIPAAAGADWLVRRLSAGRLRQGYAVLLAVLLGGLGFWILRPVNADLKHVRRTADWLGAHSAGGDVILTNMVRAGFYADRPWVDWPADWGFLDVRNRMWAVAPRYVVINVTRQRHHSEAFHHELETDGPTWMREVHRFEASGNEVRIYEPRPRPAQNSSTT